MEVGCLLVLLTQARTQQSYFTISAFSYIPNYRGGGITLYYCYTSVIVYAVYVFRSNGQTFSQSFKKSWLVRKVIDFLHLSFHLWLRSNNTWLKVSLVWMISQFSRNSPFLNWLIYKTENNKLNHFIAGDIIHHLFILYYKIFWTSEAKVSLF